MSHAEGYVAKNTSELQTERILPVGAPFARVKGRALEEAVKETVLYGKIGGTAERKLSSYSQGWKKALFFHSFCITPIVAIKREEKV